jgi:ABC-2 type transport system ATP-binding protein
MIQRVGLAQALVNDPDVIFLDEPMSGLDPLGRREVRELILKLRDEGRTVFFSSHILSDAEALCSRVAILAKGRLVAAGRVSDMVAFQTKGWEAVVESVPAEVIEGLRRIAVGVRRIAEGRYSIEFPTSPAPETALPGLLSAGGRLVSVNPIRETLEDFFVRQVGEARPAGRHEA